MSADRRCGTCGSFLKGSISQWGDCHANVLIPFSITIRVADFDQMRVQTMDGANCPCWKPADVPDR